MGFLLLGYVNIFIRNRSNVVIFYMPNCSASKNVYEKLVDKGCTFPGNITHREYVCIVIKVMNTIQLLQSMDGFPSVGCRLIQFHTTQVTGTVQLKLILLKAQNYVGKHKKWLNRSHRN